MLDLLFSKPTIQLLILSRGKAYKHLPLKNLIFLQNKKRPISIQTNDRWGCYLNNHLINFLACLLGTMMIRRNQCPIGVTS